MLLPELKSSKTGFLSSLYSNGLQSPDLNPIEHLWAIRIMDVQPTNLQQLCDAIMSICTKISEECLQHLIESLPWRIKAVLKVCMCVCVCVYIYMYVCWYSLFFVLITIMLHPMHSVTVNIKVGLCKWTLTVILLSICTHVERRVTPTSVSDSCPPHCSHPVQTPTLGKHWTKTASHDH